MLGGGVSLQSNITVTFWGARGSTPTTDADCRLFGGNTTCVHVQADGQHFIFDCGTGCIPLGAALRAQHAGERLHLLISHSHLDHIQGIPLFSPLYISGYPVDFYSEERCGLAFRAQLDQMMQRPLWPVGTERFCADVRYHTLRAGERFAIGSAVFDTMRSHHPDCCTLYRLSCGGKSIVYALDFEHGDAASPALAAFAKDCDLLIYDAFYTDEEYPAHRGYGHSTWQQGVRLAAQCGARHTVFAHLHPCRTDSELTAIQAALDPAGPRCSFAQERSALVL